MKTPNDGGPAYPTILHIEDKYGTRCEDHPGKTLRDWFAGQALSGMQCNWDKIAEYLRQNGFASNGADVAQFISSSAYTQADAMLAERNKHLNET